MADTPPNRPLNMWDIARAIGISQSTVSRALRNSPQISQAVRDKVMAAAKEMGYKPNPFVSAFTAQVRSFRRTPSKPNIAFLDTSPPGENWNVILESYVAGAERRASELGFGVDMLRLADLNNSLRTLNRVLWARSITGLLILPVPAGLDLSEVKFDDLASASLDTSLHSSGLHRATTDYFHGMQVAYDTLLAKGYRRIGFSTHQVEQLRIGDRWLGAYLLGQLQHRQAKLPPFLPSDWERDGFEKWLIKHKPDVIVSNMSLHRRWLREMGVNIPGDVAWASLNASDDFPECSGIDQRGTEVGAAGIDLIIGQIYRNEYGLREVAKSVSVKSRWVEKLTTPGPNM